MGPIRLKEIEAFESYRNRLLPLILLYQCIHTFSNVLHECLYIQIHKKECKGDRVDQRWPDRNSIPKCNQMCRSQCLYCCSKL